MNNMIEKSSKFRHYLIKHCKHLNTGNSPLFITISAVAGLLIASGASPSEILHTFLWIAFVGCLTFFLEVINSFGY